MSKNYEIDNVDLKILDLLMADAKIPYTEIAKKVFVSGGTVHVRMKKLEEMGVVTGTTLNHFNLRAVLYNRVRPFLTSGGYYV